MTVVSYSLQVAADINFAKLVVDEKDLKETAFAIPPRSLSPEALYYWRVSASSGKSTSNWSATWSFKTPAATSAVPSAGTILVRAAVDDASWSGSVSYTLTGPRTVPSGTVPQDLSMGEAGAYTISYGSGGPSGAIFSGITPSATQTLTKDGKITFTLNFKTAGTIVVNAVLEGTPWSGAASYSIAGPATSFWGDSVPRSFTAMPGAYTMSYVSGGPTADTSTSNLAYFVGIDSAARQTLLSGGIIAFTLNFKNRITASTITVSATLDDASWSGPLRYTINGGSTFSGTSVPRSFNATPGNYSFVYHYGGPYSTSWTITPSATQNLLTSGTISFTVAFSTQRKP